ncbi:MAG: YfhO family protein [Gemmatimonadetes bacterium]|nr:YfhO family protein [Gemmatimonadota bacterium]MYC93325.1 YfhO family protein [Gemmatimonadota bacterium]
MSSTQTRIPGRAAVSVPWWLTCALFVVVTVVLFAEFIFSDRMLYGEDSLSLGYMARAYFAERLNAGDFPLWSPRLLGGIPFLEAISAGDSVYPTSLLYLFIEPYRALGWKLVLHVLGGGFFMYGWARSLGLGRPAATLGGLAWLMAPVIVTLTLPGNDGKLMVASLAPLVFWAAESVLRSPSGRTAAGLAGAVALTSLTTQFQTAYFLFGTVGAYAVFRTVQLRKEPGSGSGARRPRRALVPLAIFLGSAVVGAGMAAVQLIPAAQYVTESSRRIATTVEATPQERLAYASSWSFHPEEVAALVVPEFVGNSAADADWGRNTYWGRNALKLNHEYLGVTVLALAILGFGGRRSRGLRWFMAGISLTWLLFALGAHTPVWRIFYEVVPGVSLFRVPSIAAFLVSFGVTTLFALGVDDLVRNGPSPGFLRSRRGRALLSFCGLLFAGLLLQASGALGSIWTTMIYGDAGERSLAALAAANPHITLGFGIALVLALLTAVLVWLVKEDRVPVAAALAALSLLVALDLGRIDRAFIRTFDFHAWAAPDNNTRYLEERRDAGPPFRVADLRGSDQIVDLALYELDLVAGHHPNDLARYRQLLGLEGSRASGDNTRHPNVLRMMNTKYIVWPQEAVGGPPYAGAQALSSARRGRGLEAIYTYPGLDRAWIVDRVTVMQDDEAALARILSQDFDPGSEVILAEPPDAVAGSGGAAGPVSWQLFEPDERRLRVTTTGPAVLVVSENWFPGWVAEVDGEPATVRRANLTLQAVEIPSGGDHTVTLRFTAPTVMSALRISVLAALITILLFASSHLRGLSARLRPGRRSG